MKNKILIYDDHCPLCTWYSGAFVRYGFLKEQERRSFSDLDNDLLNQIDFDKSRNEIPLLDTNTGHVFYGIDALLEILDQKIPYLKKLGNLKLINRFLRKFYKFISYNRKVIVAKKCGPANIDCSPDTNYFYRLLFISVFFIFNSLMLFPLHNQVFSHFTFYKLSILELQKAHLVFVIINCLLAFSLSRKFRIEYLGQVTMLALTSILLLIPLLFLNQFALPEWLNTIYLMLIAVFIYKEYFRRMDFAGLLFGNKWLISLNLLSHTIFLLYLF